MYGWVWQHLPGPLLLRMLTALVLIALVVMALFHWVFPWISPHVPFTHDSSGVTSG